MFVSSGLQGIVLCISSDGNVDIKLGDATVEQHCSEGHDAGHHTGDTAAAALDGCAHSCVDIAISCAMISEFALSKDAFTKDFTSTCVSFENARWAPQILQCDSVSPYRIPSMTASPDRTVVFRI
jgi:hypothetical protein